MLSLRNLSRFPAGRPLLSDDLLESHAARLLLLVQFCGTKGSIHGLTKLAKLDFFVRYPAFFAAIWRQNENGEGTAVEAPRGVESAMIRHHYGPWDPRYYHVLSFLEGCDLLQVSRSGRSFVFRLTPTGRALAKRLAAKDPFHAIVRHMQTVRAALGRFRGAELKDLIYRAFEAEVASRPLGSLIATKQQVGTGNSSNDE